MKNETANLGLFTFRPLRFTLKTTLAIKTKADITKISFNMNGHLIHIGYPKSGSTFLQEWFRQHPQLFYAPGGLGGFYNVYEVSRNASQHPNDSYMYFVTSDESLSTPHPSTGTIPIEFGMRDFTALEPSRPVQQKVCDTLRSLYPNSKILFITRGFKGIIMSGYSQYVRCGGVLTFQQFAVKSFVPQQDGKPMDKKHGEGLDYTFIIHMYEAAFGKDNMIVLPFELLRDDQKKFLSVIEARLGLPNFTAAIGRINESLSPEALYWYPRISWFVSRIAQRFGKKGYATIYRWYVGKTLRNRFDGLVKILAWSKPGRRITDVDFSAEIENSIQENLPETLTASFKDDPIYAPYLWEYFC